GAHRERAFSRCGTARAGAIGSVQVDDGGGRGNSPEPAGASSALLLERAHVGLELRAQRIDLIRDRGRGGLGTGVLEELERPGDAELRLLVIQVTERGAQRDPDGPHIHPFAVLAVHDDPCCAPVPSARTLPKVEESGPLWLMPSAVSSTRSKVARSNGFSSRCTSPRS